MGDFLTIYFSVLASEATYELLKYVGKLALRPRVRRDVRGRFAPAKVR